MSKLVNKVIKRFLSLNPIKENYCMGSYYVEYDKTGFFYVEFKTGKTLQCCVDEGERVKYLKSISNTGNGSSEGMCDDVNEWSHQIIKDIIEDLSSNSDEYICEYDIVNTIIIKEARALGFRIVD